MYGETELKRELVGGNIVMVAIEPSWSSFISGSDGAISLIVECGGQERMFRTTSGHHQLVIERDRQRLAGT